MNQIHALSRRKIITGITISLAFLLCFNTLHAQSLSVFDVDQSAFPTIKARFYAFDKDGKQVTNLSPSDITVKEDGVPRKVTFVSCPGPKPPVALSSVLVFDVSGSMSEGPPRIQSAKDAANAWVDGLPGNSECALVSFSDNSMILHDFTKDRQNLKSSISYLVPTAGTNYNQALIDEPAGGLQIAKTGKYKRVLIFLTDGQPNFEPKTQEIIDFAKQNNITIYAVTLDMPAPQCIRDITQRTGGLFFENITTKQQAEDAYQILMKVATGDNACQLEWESKTRCSAGKTNVELVCNKLSANIEYILAQSIISDLKFNPVGMMCKNKPKGVPFDTTITVTAINSDFIVTNITSDNPAFEISPKSFSIKSGQIRTLGLRFTPTDSSLQYVAFYFENDICQKPYYASGGYKGHKGGKKTLRLNQPNGGEMFAVGSDTMITWTGILPNDTVSLELSTDNGTSWRIISDNASGFEYTWKNVPKPPSNKCLVRISTNTDAIPQIEWQKCLGGSDNDFARSIIETSDGGFVVASDTYSILGGDVMGNHGDSDYWIVKLDQTGQIHWQKCLGGSKDDVAQSLIETSDGGFVVAGYTHSNDGDVSDYYGGRDYWIVKLDQTGQLQWQKCLGGVSNEEAQSIIETSDGGFVVAGYTQSNDGDISGNHGGRDYWIVKLDQTGQLQWQKCLGGSKDDVAQSIIQTGDGGFVVAGYTASIDGDVSGNNGWSDFWLVKLDQTGQIQWQKCLGGSSFEDAQSIIETSDGGLVVAGNTNSNDGDVSGNHGQADYWIVKLTQAGQLLWQKCLGGTKDDIALSIIQTNDGGIVAAGYSQSYDGDVSGNHGGYDSWIVKLSQTGKLKWQKCLGGVSYEEVQSIIETRAGGLIVAGCTSTNELEASHNHGYRDSRIVKLSPESFFQSDASDSLFSIVMPMASSIDIDLKQCLLGRAKDSLVSNFISNTGSYKCRIDSIYFTGADAPAFSLVSGLPKYEIAVGTSHPAEFNFRPSRVGIHQAQVVIITQGDTLVQNIRGEGVQPMIALVDDIIDFGVVEIGESKDTLQALTIKNVGTNPVDIISTKHIWPNDKDFTTILGAGPFSLSPGETAKMNLRFTPTEIGRTNGRLEFNFNGPGSPAVVRLFGQGLGGSVIISNDSAYAGDRRKLRLSLAGKAKPTAQMLVTQFKAKLSYNKTLLTMLEPGAIKSTDSVNELSEITAGWDGSTSTLGEFEVMAALGNYETTDLIINEFNWLNDKGESVDFETETTNGTFKILGLCREGGSRFINPAGMELIKSIYPNPSKDEIVINFELTESGCSRIYLTNILGEKAKDIMSDKNPALGQQSITINVNDLSSGTYYLILETMNGCRSRRVEVIK